MADRHEGKPLETETGTYLCQCVRCRIGGSRFCLGQERVRKHCTSVARLVSNCVDTVVVFVGAEERKFVCHKAILGFSSDFFDAAFYGTMKEANESTISMPEEDCTAFQAFVSWAYTGQINSCVCPEELWVLGDKLQSARFSNAVMFHMFDGYRDEDTFISTKSVEIAFYEIADGSKLRKFLMDLLNVQGPFCKRVLESKKAAGYVRDWQRLIQSGGDIVLQIVQNASLIDDYWANWDDAEEEIPTWMESQHKYLLPITSRPIDDFLQGKKRSTPL
ncbi:hypothetical protein ONS95_009472 [Cadophora gregata]|uniref:uncharacterized protein n=1 Tax=Cadophora gregata TaxID=51156 RepID=UPI0026DB1EBF|nr:uncharacterized protein ONS95_009472 [Cadophora gregata]KAK0124523.1 hypothetical protein ONS95_009472 [Cadophora gregata]